MTSLNGNNVIIKRQMYREKELKDEINNIKGGINRIKE